MSAIVEKQFDRHFSPRQRHWSLPRLALRQRSQEHPMVVFFAVVITAFTAMALVPPTGSAFASFGVSPAVSAPAVGQASAVAATGLSRTDIDCNGQAWGAESADCLATIARESGVDSRKVRVIAGA